MSAKHSEQFLALTGATRPLAACHCCMCVHLWPDAVLSQCRQYQYYYNTWVIVAFISHDADGKLRHPRHLVDSTLFLLHTC